MNCEEYRELVAPHVDSALSDEEIRSVRAHLSDCVACDKIFDWESKAAKTLKAKWPNISPPPGARERLLERLNRLERRGWLLGWILPKPQVAGSFALLAVILVAVWILPDSSENDLLMHAVAQHERFTAQGPGASRRVSEPSPVARRLDLTLLGYAVEEDRIDKTMGRERRLSVFAKTGNDLVLAQEFEGVKITFPANARRVQVKSREFIALRHGRVNLVAWQDNGALCVLTSELPADKLIGLAERVVERS